MVDPILLAPVGGIAVLAVGVMEWRLRRARAALWSDFRDYRMSAEALLDLREREFDVTLTEMRGRIETIGGWAEKASNHVHPLPSHEHAHYSIVGHEHSVPPHEHPAAAAHEHPFAALEHAHPLPEHGHGVPLHEHPLAEHSHAELAAAGHEHPHDHPLPEHAHELPEHGHPLAEHRHEAAEHDHEEYATRDHFHPAGKDGAPAAAHAHAWERRERPSRGGAPHRYLFCPGCGAQRAVEG